MGDAHAVRPRAAARPAFPRLSRQAGFGVVAYAFFVVTAFSTAPSSLYLADLSGGAARRATVAATVANIGGLATGPLIAGVLARSAPPELTLPFDVFVAALLVALLGVALAPEAHPGLRPRPRYRPQRLRVPPHTRAQFFAALVGTFLCFAVFGLFAGLAGRFLAGPLGHPSPALAGLAIFLTFAAGVTVQVATMSGAAGRLIGAGIPPTLIGLAILVASAWTSPPTLALFLLGGIVAGAGGGAIFRGSLTTAMSLSIPEERAGALATFFVAGYAGISVPVLGVGIALEHLSARVTLLGFGVAVGLGLLAAAPTLTGRG